MRRVCVFTGTRADYGLLVPLLRELRGTPSVTLQLLVSGTHLAPGFGLSDRDIEGDGFRIDERVEMLLASDTPVGVAKSMGLGTIGFAEALDRLRPDVLVVLGDRYEALAVVQAALVARVPVAHVHGGETTEGAVDESIRHAITKLSHLHFVAAEPFRQRVLQLGEQPDRVHTVGSPGLDDVADLARLDRADLEASLEIALPAPLLLVTYHPVTLADHGPRSALAALFAALNRHDDVTVLATRPNADVGGHEIAAAFGAYAVRRRGRVHVVANLGRRRYLSALRLADAVVGNSSSGLIEAPALGTPTVNVGDRQRGRLRAASVVDCAEDADAIAAALTTVRDPGFRASLAGVCSPYGDGQSAPRIARILATTDLGGILLKRFHDLAENPR